MNAPKGWKRHRKLTNAENLDLPVPRLEIRYSSAADGLAAKYSLVYEHFLGHLMQIPIGLTMCGGGHLKSKGEDYLELPFREGAHIASDMLQLGLPGYIINGAKSAAVSLDIKSIPNGVLGRYRRAEKKKAGK